ncbi:penicillin acylase family protein [Stagnihabitans tardus]|uniref:Penicillin acylase family protein n=1 Tax=Stagnihabitans tardus TaxID=2699202 RepID=A0AAE4Y5C1_9RHOB|nr:penicillin acylase family protein [Stagnihabitans tardus]NBZ85993.1 penicillin acylase family protein [Stagnihabitans tardus]
MLTAFRWTLRGFIALIGLGLLALLILYYFLSRSLPDYAATWEVPGIAAPVEIVRDANAIPHIFAASDTDAYYALGFAHAQDRLWQMMLMRRTAQGRLSEIFGTRTLKTDELLRRLDLYTLSLSSVAVQDDYTKAALQAYADGVNAWIGQVNANALGRGAPEFFLFPAQIDAWAPADSLAIIKLMALQLSGHLDNEVLRAELSQTISPARLRDLLPDVTGPGIAALPQYSQLMPGPYGSPLPEARRATLDLPLSPFPSADMAGASNAWAASPARSAAGGSLLANDPHLGFTAPSTWYLARLRLSTGDVIGATIPGMPLVLLGRSEKLGWGLTSSYLDDQDVVMEKVNPANPEQYLTPEGPKDFTSRRTIIQVKDAAPVTITQRWSESGPILPGAHYDLGTVTPAGAVPALEWTALDGADTTMSAGLRLMRAQSVEEGLAAMEGFVAPSQNLMLVDASNIAMQLVGKMPMRDPAHATQGRMPAPGWQGKNRWTGYFPYAENLRVLNPAAGLIGNTNNKIVDAPFPRHVSFTWGDTQRIQRWLTLMKTREVHTRSSFMEAQLDTVSPTLRTLLPLIGKDLWFTGEPAVQGTPERQRQDALTLLAAWNGEENEHLPEPLIAEAWLRAIQARLMRDEVGPLADQFLRPAPEFIERVYRNTDGASVWCDVVQSAAVESCSEIARLALDDALLGLSETYGPKIESWRWGDAHEAAHDHPVLGEVPILQYFVNIRQSTSGGDFTLMRGRTVGTGETPYENVHGGGYRGVYDFADPESSVFVIATGESGHPLSRHYDDLSELWRRGEYVPMTLDPQLARAGAVGVTTLVPAP